MFLRLATFPAELPDDKGNDMCLQDFEIMRAVKTEVCIIQPGANRELPPDPTIYGLSMGSSTAGTNAIDVSNDGGATWYRWTARTAGSVAQQYTVLGGGFPVGCHLRLVAGAGTAVFLIFRLNWEPEFKNACNLGK